MSEERTTQWVDVNEIQKRYLPISKKAIRKLLKDNLDVARTGKKILVERTQLEDFLRNNI
ncbi:MAG: hypothetical protein IJZ25_04930 [Lachnospiraceae bacterium]|nr:hypothetical protein [Lachnospiraceae bacterium]